MSSNRVGFLSLKTWRVDQVYLWLFRCLLRDHLAPTAMYVIRLHSSYSVNEFVNAWNSTLHCCRVELILRPWLHTPTSSCKSP